MPNAEAFVPNPWLMGVVMVGAGVVLWWLAGEMSPGRTARRPRPRAERWVAAMSGWHPWLLRIGAVWIVVLGVAVLAATGMA